MICGLRNWCCVNLFVVNCFMYFSSNVSDVRIFLLIGRCICCFFVFSLLEEFDFDLGDLIEIVVCLVMFKYLGKKFICVV